MSHEREQRLTATTTLRTPLHHQTLTSPMASPPPPPRLLTPKPDPDAPLPPLPYPALTPELCDHLRRELDLHPNLAQCLLLSAQSPPPLHIQPAPASSANAQPPSAATATTTKKKRARASQEVVRITNLSLADHLHYRSLVRRARLTFEALRAIYQRQDLAPTGGSRNRFDLRASSKMLSKGLWMHRDIRIVGAIPGVLVGDSFFYRAELCVLGLHTAPQAGIGYIPGSIVDEGHPVATSIVSSGGYLDDEDSGDVLVYTGSGGRMRNRLDHSADQTLQRGNLALHYSCHYGVEVRVIRGHACDHSPSRKVYVYDGLYRVVTSTFGPGKSGRDVCKFKLVRIPGQDDLGSKTWHAATELKDALDAKIRPPKYISLDIAKGKEPFRVPVYNKLDDDRTPLFYEYIACPEFPRQQLVKRQRGCHCAEVCGSRCSCERKNRGADGPVYNLDGTLLRGRPVVYECGALCGCPMTCPNRVSQQGMKHRLEVFRSKETGWGVRTLDLIQPGAFICEYAGDVLSLDSHSGDAPPPPMEDGSSIIDPSKFPGRWKEWGDASAVYPDKVPHFPLFAGARYRLDVSQRRNVACYISHSCSPNVFLQYVIHGNEDESYPHMMVFAMETIPPMRDLCIDYGLD